MEAMLALALDLSGWRGPVAFGAVSLFVVAALGRLMSMIAARRRRRVWLSEGYKSREDVQMARREENIEDWLEKMRSTPEEFRGPKPAPAAIESAGGEKFVETVDKMIKEFSKGIEKVVSLEKPEAQPPDPIEKFGITAPYPKGYTPTLRYNWYRTPDGSLLFRTTAKDIKVSHDFSVFMDHLGIQSVTTFENLRVAFPKVGEWWMKAECKMHPIEREVRIQVREEYSWYLSPERDEQLYCGCLMPINFGKEFPKVAGSEYLKEAPGSNGGSGREGADGPSGITAIQASENRCTLCAGASEVQKDIGAGMKIVVPCPQCKGTGS